MNPPISYLILTNNNNQVFDCLNFLKKYKDAEDEIVILDDCSPPEFVGRLKQYSDVIVNHKLEYSFSEHRNFALPFCKGDYIFALDSDECPHFYLIKILKNLLIKSQGDVYSVPRCNIFKGITPQIAQKWNWRLDGEVVNWPDYQNRLFKNKIGLKWINNLHEGLDLNPSHKVFTIDRDIKLAIIHRKPIETQIKSFAHYVKKYSSEENAGFTFQEIFYSQFGEDEWLAKNVTLPDNGFYVDLGAAQPTIGSNTQFLRNRDWKGIQIDANEKYKPLWDDIGHELTVGIVATKDFVPFHFDAEPTISKVQEGCAELPAIKINDLLKAKQVFRIDLLSIDIEGLEYDVLQTLDWDKYKPTVIIAEFNTNGKLDNRLPDYLKTKGYEIIHKTVANYIFKLC